MSDSDEDLLPESVLRYQHDRTVINANTTNFNNTNITSYSLRNNMMASSYNMANVEQQRFGTFSSDQRNMYYGRETSPISQRSYPNSGIRNFQNPLYSRGMSSQRSVYNGRSRSPMSMRSVDSNASVSAADIASAFKNEKFNKYDIRMIKEAYNQFMKKRVRKRIEKRRNLKFSQRSHRHTWSDDSGELGSGSEVSDDDCKSYQTTIYKENIQRPIPRPMNADLMNIRNAVLENDMYKDCTKNLKQSALRNMFAVNSSSHSNTSREKLESSCVVTLKDRFKKGESFLLPSQRFNKSTANLTNNHTVHSHVMTNTVSYVNNQCVHQDFNSETEDIFPEKIRENSQQNSTALRKRVLENGDKINSERKRNKTSISPIKLKECDSIMDNNDFNFKKPQMPVRKSNMSKKDSTERLIAKSGPLTESLDLDLPINNNLKQQKVTHYISISEQNKDLLQNGTDTDLTNQKETAQNMTEVSMRPSFIKRKLFTQNLDVAQSKNISNDNINSPQSKLYNECREKTKVRKLVTSQSCLSRDVLGDDNVLNLIHKIVPPDQMNITNASIRKDSNKYNQDCNDKWDVTSVISMCNNEDGSDTYTDEEIFKAPQNITTKKTEESNKVIEKQLNVKSKFYEHEINVKSLDDNKLKTNCKIVLQKLSATGDVIRHNNIEIKENKTENKRTASTCVRTFWDTDFESDMEEKSQTPWKTRCQPNQSNLLKDTTNILSSGNANRRNVIKGTILTVRSFQNKGINSSARSDISKPSVQKYKDLTINQEQSEENNNEVVNRTIQNNQKVVKEVKNNTPKSKRHSKTGETNKKVNEKTKAKPVEKKGNQNNKTQLHNNCNTSRESLRLKQKREKAKLNSNASNNASTIDEKGKSVRKTKNSQNNINDAINNDKSNKNENTSKTKNVKKSIVNNGTINRTKKTPIKGKEKKQLSMTLRDQSSLNISNILNRSLRVRRKIHK